MQFWCYPYVNHMYSYVTSISFVCHSYVLVCHSCVTHMYSYIISIYLHVTHITLVCTLMSSVCHSHLLVCHPYVTRMWFVNNVLSNKHWDYVSKIPDKYKDSYLSVFCKKAVLKVFRKVTREHSWCNANLVKLQVFSLQYLT